MILETIQSRQDLLSLNPMQLEILSQEIRQFLIDHVSRTGGHLASNLGIVEIIRILKFLKLLNIVKIIIDIFFIYIIFIDFIHII